MIRRRLSRCPVVCLLAVLACADAQRVAVHVTLDGIPLERLSITALPFDPAAVLDSLAATAPAPPPDFPGLDSAIRSFAPADARDVDGAAAPWRVLRDSAAALADSLAGLDRRTQQYEAMYERFRRLYQRLAERTADRDRALRSLHGEDRALAERVRRAAESLREWEETAYAAFPAIAEGVALETGGAGQEATTDSTGAARFALAPGPWWLVARHPHPTNPFLEYEWSYPLVLTGLAPLRVPLDRGVATVRWRH